MPPLRRWALPPSVAALRLRVRPRSRLVPLWSPDLVELRPLPWQGEAQPLPVPLVEVQRPAVVLARPARPAAVPHLAARPALVVELLGLPVEVPPALLVVAQVKRPGAQVMPPLVALVKGPAARLLVERLAGLTLAPVVTLVRPVRVPANLVAVTPLVALKHPVAGLRVAVRLPGALLLRALHLVGLVPLVAGLTVAVAREDLAWTPGLPAVRNQLALAVPVMVGPLVAVQLLREPHRTLAGALVPPAVQVLGKHSS